MLTDYNKWADEVAQLITGSQDHLETREKLMAMIIHPDPFPPQVEMVFHLHPIVKVAALGLVLSFQHVGGNSDVGLEETVCSCALQMAEWAEQYRGSELMTLQMPTEPSLSEKAAVLVSIAQEAMPIVRSVPV